MDTLYKLHSNLRIGIGISTRIGIGIGIGKNFGIGTSYCEPQWRAALAKRTRMKHYLPEVGTNNTVPKAQRNFCNKVIDLVEAQRNSAIAEHFRTKLKRNLTSAMKFHNTNTAFSATLDIKRVHNC